MKVFINNNRLLDHMMVDAYLRCWNYYFFKYVLGMSEATFPEALVYGIMFHSGLGEWYETGSLEKAEKAFIRAANEWKYEKNSEHTKIRTISNGIEKLRMYCGIYKNDYFKRTSVELEHFVPMEALQRSGNLVNNTSKGFQRYVTKGIPVWYGTHVDAIGKVNDKISFLEHKTTSLYNSSPLLETYTYGLQVKGYSMAMCDHFSLAEPCNGYLDLIYLRAKKREDVTARYPLFFDARQIEFFKTTLAEIIGTILWKEKVLDEWTIPMPSNCSNYGRICEYDQVCRMLPDVRLCHRFLQNSRFKATLPARLDKIQERPIVGQVDPNKLYYTVIPGATL